MAIAFDRVKKPLRQLRKSLRQLSDNPAPDRVHKLRTGARQVEAIASAIPPASEKLARRLLKCIKMVRKAAGRVRDMDVLTAHAHTLPQQPHNQALARLVEHLEQSRKAHADTLLRTLDLQRKTARAHLKTYSGQLEKRNKSSVLLSDVEGQVHASAARLTAEISRWPSLSPHNLHGFRLKVKELRAVLQLLPSSDHVLVNDLGVVKDRIGAWHDWLQLAKTATEVLDAGQDNGLLTLIRQTGKQKLTEALATANALRQRHLQLPLKKPPVSERQEPVTIKARRNPAA